MLDGLGRIFSRIDWKAQAMVLLRHPVHIVLALAIGGGGAFVYSYRPLHGAKVWQIDYLQQRVDAQNVQIRDLEMELAKVKSEASSRPEPEDFAAQTREMKSAKAAVGKLESDAKRSERTIKSLRSSLEQWKAKHAKAAAELESIQAGALAAAEPETSGSPESEPSSPPASPAAPEEPPAAEAPFPQAGQEPPSSAP